MERSTRTGFRVNSEYQPTGDQPRAIEGLADAISAGERFVTLLGITGSGKSATIAWTIEQVQRPALVLAPTRELAAQIVEDARPHRRQPGHLGAVLHAAQDPRRAARHPHRGMSPCAARSWSG
jgi:superfamily II DNA or RNA helicase